MPDVVLKAYDLGHDVRHTIASSYTLHNVSMGLNTRLRGFLSFYSMILLIPTHRLQKKRVENSDGKLPRNVVQDSNVQLPTRRTVESISLERDSCAADLGDVRCNEIMVPRSRVKIQ